MDQTQSPSFVGSSCSGQLPGSGSSFDDEPVLIVEERLHICAASLACLRDVARLAERDSDIPLLSSRERFARVVRQFIRGLESQLAAIKLALPVSATNLRAPAATQASEEKVAVAQLDRASCPQSQVSQGASFAESEEGGNCSVQDVQR